VSVWNLAAAWYHAALQRVPLGTIVAVMGYRMRVYRGDYEASLNDKSPVGRIFMLREDAALFDPPGSPTVARLPHLDLRFTPVAAVARLPDAARLSVVRATLAASRLRRPRPPHHHHLHPPTHTTAGGVHYARGARVPPPGDSQRL